MKHDKQFTSEQRYQISELKEAGLKPWQISDEVGVHKSPISREFRRNKGQRGWRPKQDQELQGERHPACINAKRFAVNDGTGNDGAGTQNERGLKNLGAAA